jgi:hypothetical protein
MRVYKKIDSVLYWLFEPDDNEKYVDFWLRWATWRGFSITMGLGALIGLWITYFICSIVS